MAVAHLDQQIATRVDELGRGSKKLLIDGDWVEAASGKTFSTPNPATGERLADVAHGEAEDINRAVRAARRAFEEGPWRTMSPSDRGKIIWRIGDLIEES
jgi:acyl-CoA reductase-like NAD-dependent aldehyde dehydrogenase